ncbi:piggyBac transposable element-derived protein 4-like [Lineus longissimus]|uniref:piggyBac transposable element-derived protein 4-like n=1 Tax=Lineus longissimus TaxID=88925 RepID=UPI00315CAFA5
MLWKGRLSWKQYIPSKRARYEIKSFEICESSSGYIWDFFVYTGKDTEYRQEYRQMDSMGAKVVLTLAHNLLGKGYTVNMDNFFSAPQLYDKLCESNTDAVGTLRANRKEVPKQLTGKRLKKGEIAALYCGKLMALKWKDKKDVHMLSTYHDARTVEIPARRAQEAKVKPKVCCDYNNTMGGVDLIDAYLHAYPSARKRLKKYYKKQFRHLLDMAALNIP